MIKVQFWLWQKNLLFLSVVSPSICCNLLLIYVVILVLITKKLTQKQNLQDNSQSNVDPLVGQTGREAVVPQVNKFDFLSLPPKWTNHMSSSYLAGLLLDELWKGIMWLVHFSAIYKEGNLKLITYVSCLNLFWW